MKNLVIVESPTKARTISRFLGKDYEIKFSMGHVMDLPKSKLGVDVEHNFKPDHEVLRDKKQMIAELRSAAKSADVILLATDPDREGEAISADIKHLLTGSGKSGINNRKFQRVVFHEITEGAIREAIEHPRDIDTHLVDAQIARRVLDRLVGYQLSPVLWRKVRRGLSAGRVQSVALRLIVEREREIEKFLKTPYWTIVAGLKKEIQETAVPFELIAVNGEKIETTEKFELYAGEYKITKTTIDTQEKADEIVSDIKRKQFRVVDVLEREMRRSPLPPYTTSTLQQDASRRFGFPGKRTMSLAQKLYEEGFITYHRTDSVTLSHVALDQIRTFVQREYGTEYIPEKPRFYTTKQKSAQEAHEGIRPTHITTTESKVLSSLGKDYAKLYGLIWRRTVASQMSDARIESTTVVAENSMGEGAMENTLYRLKASGSVLQFDGFLRVNPQALQDIQLPQFTVGEDLTTQSVSAEGHETPPPPRYNDASIIQTLEERGIGRPSTYATIISTIIDRGYIERSEKRFVPTAVGVAVTDFLVKNFSTIDDIPFTAEMEDNLDEIANGQKEWVAMMQEFYQPFSKKLTEVEGAERVKIAVEETDEVCPECHKGNLVVRTGKFGKFLSCSRFPECKFTKPLVIETDIPCPKDRGKIIQRKTRKGRIFYGCANYPNCDFAVWKLEDIGKNGGPSAESRGKERNGKSGVGKRYGTGRKATAKRNMVKRVVRKRRTSTTR